MMDLEQTFTHPKEVEQNLNAQREIIAATLRRISEGGLTTNHEGKVVAMDPVA